MENNKTQLEMNEDVRSEMEKILWTPEETVDTSNNDAKDIDVELINSKTKQTEVEITTDTKINNDKADETSNKSEKVKKEKKTTKRNVIKAGDPDWASKIPEEQRLQPGDIICLTVDNLNKFGEFIEYGKKEGVYWVNMRKKDSLELMSKKWSVKDFECDIVFHNGELNPKYTVDEKGIYRIK